MNEMEKTQALAEFLNLNEKGVLDFVYNNRENLEERLIRIAKKDSVNKSDLTSFVDFYKSIEDIFKFVPRIPLILGNHRYEDCKPQIDYTIELSNKFNKIKKKISEDLEQKLQKSAGADEKDETEALLKSYAGLKQIDGFEIPLFERYIMQSNSFRNEFKEIESKYYFNPSDKNKSKKEIKSLMKKYKEDRGLLKSEYAEAEALSRKIKGSPAEEILRKEVVKIKITPPKSAKLLYGALAIFVGVAIGAGVYFGAKKPQGQIVQAQPNPVIYEPAPQKEAKETIYEPAPKKEAEQVIVEKPVPKEETVIVDPEITAVSVALSRFYIKPVKPGDTLKDIVEKYQMQGMCKEDFARCKALWTKLAKDNEIYNPDKIVEGQILLLPKGTLTSSGGLIDGSKITDKNLPRKYFVMTKGQAPHDLSRALMGNYDRDFIEKVVRHPLNKNGSIFVPYDEKWVWIPNDVQVKYEGLLREFKVPGA